MKHNEALFDLIKSLNKSEKRYFKLFSSLQSGEKMYLQLFDAIDKQEKYDEKKLLQQYANTSLEKHTGYMKHYLYQLILKSMQTYRSEANVDIQLMGMLSNMDFLFDKGLYKQCNKIITRAKKLAEKYEKHWCLIELGRCKLNLIRINGYSGTSMNDLEQNYSKIFHWLRQYINNNEYRLLADKMFLQLKQKGLPRGNTEMESYQKIMNSPLLTKEKKYLSYDTSYSYHAINIVYHSIRNNFEKEYQYIQKSIDSMDAHPHQIASNPMPYLSTLYNLIFCQFQLGKYAEIPAVIKQIRELVVKPKRIRQQIFYSANSLELKLYYRTGQFAQGMMLTNAIKDKIVPFDVAFIERQLELNYFISCIYFGAENYTLANSWLNKILNDTTIDIRSDLLCFAQILHLIIHYEKDNEDYIAYIVVNAERFIKNRKQLYRFEKAMLDFFRKTLPKINTHKERINAFKALKAKIEEITKDPYEKKALDYFDFISWIDSKIEERTFGEVVRGKVS